jgi:hypothetical protein
VSVATDNPVHGMSDSHAVPKNHKRRKLSRASSSDSLKTNVPRSSQSRRRIHKPFIVLDSDDENIVVTGPAKEIKASDPYIPLHAEPSATNASLCAGKWYKREQIHSVLGGNQQRTITKYVAIALSIMMHAIFTNCSYTIRDLRQGKPLGVRNVAFFAVIKNPLVPSSPGDDGVAFLGLTHEADIGTNGPLEDTFEVFTDRSALPRSSKRNFWRYIGTYRFTRSAPLTINEWQSLTEKVSLLDVSPCSAS